MAEMGVHSVAYAFPRVRIITTAVDKEVNDQFHIIPGIGEDVCVSGNVLELQAQSHCRLHQIRKRQLSICMSGGHILGLNQEL